MLNFFVDFLTVFPHGRKIFELMVVFYVEAISSVDNFCGSSGFFVFWSIPIHILKRFSKVIHRHFDECLEF
jgi:hypothetical protein